MNHRTLVSERHVLHRDMSRYNPQWGKFQVTHFMDNRPPLIEDVLAGELRYVLRCWRHYLSLIY